MVAYISECYYWMVTTSTVDFLISSHEKHVFNYNLRIELDNYDYNLNQFPSTFLSYSYCSTNTNAKLNPQFTLASNDNFHIRATNCFHYIGVRVNMVVSESLSWVISCYSISTCHFICSWSGWRTKSTTKGNSLPIRVCPARFVNGVVP